ncbi:hypothetical protein K4L44_01840 [Halosquirtibacter laminarini]|uniref:Uncharacterized protein n=1 Tax=Halosquirtibacter laminarini TaxID=3374600 RepID=A0AC61NPT0_9BACT|nr:hypothetical protein K4L44_01840 [Prolixibacteraceae bacterium]
MRKALLLLLFIFAYNTLFSATYRMNIDYLGTETKKDLSYWSAENGGKIRLDKSRYKLGFRSLKWEYNSHEGKLVYNNPALITQALNRYKGGFMTWIYNDKTVNDSIKIEFSKDNKEKLHFYYHLNFTGWRACWIRFKEDMKGDKSCKSIDKMVIHAPKSRNKGTLWFDRMAFPKRRIHDRCTPDMQLPWINPLMNENHWAALYYWESHYTCDLVQPIELDKQQDASLNTIYKRTKAICKGPEPSLKEIKWADEQMKQWNIRRLKNSITGVPFVSFDESSPSEIILNNAGKVLYIYANDYYYNKEISSAKQFRLLLDHLMEQGLAYGSGIGTNHHYGYQFTLYPKSIFLMNDYLIETGSKEEVEKMLCYWTGLQEMRILPKIGTLQGVVDSWNTTIMPKIIAASTISDKKERYVAYQMIQRWVDQSLKLVPGTMGGIKEDGTVFHHGANYPAYTIGGMDGIKEYVRMMKDTEFQINKNSRKNIGLVLKNLFHSTNKSYWSLGISGRHPLGGKINKGTIQLYGEISVLGNPMDNKEQIWNEIAGMYIDLGGNDSNINKQLDQAKIDSYSYPENCFYSYNYNALATVNHKNWQATIKGYNQDVWCSEIYVKDNRYGRYQSYGSLMIMSNGLQGSGYVQKGWDWNRVPGTTTIHLPLDKLESFRKGVLMEKSNESFSGSANLDHQVGLFATIIQEKDHPNFTPSFRAMKSVFYFDEILVCLGNNIQNDNKDYPTETTIFQTHTDKKDGVNEYGNLNSRTVTETQWMMDPLSNGYIFPQNTELQFENKIQKSKHNKTKKETSNRFSSLVINHGYAPKGQKYEYIIVPQTKKADIKELSSKIEKGQKPYEVMRNDSNCTSISIPQKNVRMYAFFHGTSSKDDLLSSVSESCFVIIREDPLSKEVVITDPSLHIHDKKMITSKKSQKKIIKIALKGYWNINTENKDLIHHIQHNNSNTYFEVTCWKGRLNKIKITNK